MKGNARDYQTAVVYDEAEVRRRMWKVYSFLLEEARASRQPNTQAVATQIDPVCSSGLV